MSVFDAIGNVVVTAGRLAGSAVVAIGDATIEANLFDRKIEKLNQLMVDINAAKDDPYWGTSTKRRRIEERLVEMRAMIEEIMPIEEG